MRKGNRILQDHLGRTVRAILRSIAVTMGVTFGLIGSCEAKPQTIPFDFSRSAILWEVAVRGIPLHMFLDTGVNPSTIDATQAKSLGLKIDYAGGGEASGDGNADHVMVYPTSIEDLIIGGRRFGSVEALTLNMTPISKAYGSVVDGTLGYSFLHGKILLIDYPAQTVTIFDKEAEAAAQLSECRKIWRTPLKSFQGDHIPIVELRIGHMRVPVSIDTGSNGNIELFKKALDAAEIKAGLLETGTSTSTGTRGAYAVKTYRLNTSISFGPFTLPAGQIVTLSSNEGSAKTRLANIGNKLLASMQAKLLLDYRQSKVALFGDCAH